MYVFVYVSVYLHNVKLRNFPVTMVTGQNTEWRCSKFQETFLAPTADK